MLHQTMASLQIQPLI